MSDERFVIRMNPPLEFVFRDSGFEILTADSKKRACFYSYVHVEDLRLMPKKTNWLTSILFITLEFFMIGTTLGRLYSDKAQLVFNYKANLNKIEPLDCKDDTLLKVLEILILKTTKT